MCQRVRAVKGAINGWGAQFMRKGSTSTECERAPTGGAYSCVSLRGSSNFLHYSFAHCVGLADTRAIRACTNVQTQTADYTRHDTGLTARDNLPYFFFSLSNMTSGIPQNKLIGDGVGIVLRRVLKCNAFTRNMMATASLLLVLTDSCCE